MPIISRGSKNSSAPWSATSPVAQQIDSAIEENYRTEL